MKLIIVVSILLAGVFLQVSSHPSGESATAEVAADVGTDLLQFTGGCTFHALIAQISNFIVTISSKDSVHWNFCTALIDEIKRYKSGKVIKFEDALTNFTNGKDTYYSRFAEVIVSITGPNCSWTEIRETSWKYMSTHFQGFTGIFHKFFKDGKFWKLDDFSKFFHSIFSGCDKQ